MDDEIVRAFQRIAELCALDGDHSEEILRVVWKTLEGEGICIACGTRHDPAEESCPKVA